MNRSFFCLNQKGFNQAMQQKVPTTEKIYCIVTIPTLRDRSVELVETTESPVNRHGRYCRLMGVSCVTPDASTAVTFEEWWNPEGYGK